VITGATRTISSSTWLRGDGLDLQDVAEVGDAEQLAHRQIHPQFGVSTPENPGDLGVHLPRDELPDQDRGLVVGRCAPKDRHGWGA
jgi:hypothetical protein